MLIMQSRNGQMFPINVVVKLKVLRLSKCKCSISYKTRKTFLKTKFHIEKENAAFTHFWQAK